MVHDKELTRCLPDLEREGQNTNVQEKLHLWQNFLSGLDTN